MIIELHSIDSPKRPGYQAQDGDEVFTMIIPLDNGDILNLYLGKASQLDFRAVILEADIDDVIEGALEDGTSHNENKVEPGSMG